MAENLSALFPEFNSYRNEINTKDCLLLNIHTSSEKHLLGFYYHFHSAVSKRSATQHSVDESLMLFILLCV